MKEFVCAWGLSKKWVNVHVKKQEKMRNRKWQKVTKEEKYGNPSARELKRDTNSKEERDRGEVRSCEVENTAKSHTDCTYWQLGLKMLQNTHSGLHVRPNSCVRKQPRRES